MSIALALVIAIMQSVWRVFYATLTRLQYKAH